MGGLSRIAVRALDETGTAVGSSVVLDPLAPQLRRSMPTVDLAGDMSVRAWIELSEVTADTCRLAAAWSADGGKTWSAGTIVDTLVQKTNGPAVATNGRTWLLTYAWFTRKVVRLDVSTRSWNHVYTAPTDDLEAFRSHGDIVSTPDAAFGLTYTARVVSTGLAAVLFSLSKDEGSTWTPPRIVSRAEAMGQHASEPYLWADESGCFHIVWRQNTPYVPDLALFYSRSTDAGVTWTPPTELTEKPGPLAIGGSGAASVCVDAAGETYVGWAEDEGRYRLHFAKTRTRPFSIDLDPDPQLRAIPNPFRLRASVSVPVPEPASVTASIFDAGGRLISQIRDRASNRGELALTWSGISDAGAPVTPGVYWWSITVTGDTYRRTHRARTVRAPRRSRTPVIARSPRARSS